MPRTRQDGQVRIHDHDIFGGIFSLMVIRGYTSIRPHNSHNTYDAACAAVSAEVEKLCEQRDWWCDFRIRIHPIHGDSPTARDQLLFWQSLRLLHSRVPPNGNLYFDMSKDDAEEWLQKCIDNTTFDREVFVRLTNLFLEIFQEG